MRLNRYVITLLIALFPTVLCASPLQIVTITSDFASIAKSVGGDHVETTSLVEGSQDLHHINPRPSMVLKVKKADLLIRLGLGQDGWIDQLVLTARNRNVFSGQPGYLDASERITKLDIPRGNINGGMGDIHKYGNPHYWLNPKNGVVIAREITDKLIQLDPKNSADYENNYTQFTESLESKIKVWETELSPLKGTWIVTYHSTWRYFTDCFGLNVVGHLEPLPGIPPTISHLNELKNTLQAAPDKMVMMAEFYNVHIGEKFAADMHAKFVTLPTNVNPKTIPSYIDLFDEIVERLTK